MQIRSAQFIKGAVGNDRIFEDGTPQIAFIGRSNAGKSSVINSLVNQKNLAHTSSFPGRTQEINIFHINKAFYLVDLPGYGFMKTSPKLRDHLAKMIDWYFFRSEYKQKKVVIILDANIGTTDLDMDMLYRLEAAQKNIIIVANKIDKIKKSEYENKMQDIRDRVGNHIIIPYSAEKKIGVGELSDQILK